MPQQPSSFLRLLHHTRTHHNRYDSSGRVIGPSQRPLPDNTQYSRQTDIHASGGIWTRYPSKGAATDPRLGPRSHWHRQSLAQNYVILVGILWSDMAVSGLIKWSNGWITCRNFLSLCLHSGYVFLIYILICM